MPLSMHMVYSPWSIIGLGLCLLLLLVLCVVPQAGARC